MKPRLEGLSLLSGLKLWLSTTRTTTLWIVMHFSSSIPLPLSFSSSLLLVRVQQRGTCLMLGGSRKEAGERRDNLFPFFSLTQEFPQRGLCGKIHVAFYPMGKHICN